MAKIQFVGAAEIEEQHGIPRYHIHRLVARGLLPQPYQTLKAGSIWVKSDITAAARRLPKRR